MRSTDTANGPLSNQRHELFSQALAKGMSSDEAYRTAGYAPNRGNAATLKAKQSIQRRVVELQCHIAEKTTVDAAWLLDRLAEEANADVADLFGPDGTLRPVTEWPAIWRKGLVSGMDVDEFGRVVKVRLSDRIKRLELIGKHVSVQAFKEQLDVNVSLSVDAAISRLEAQGVIEGDYGVIERESRHP